MADRKNVLVFSEDFPPYPGGIAQWAMGMAGALARRGKRVCVLTRWRPDFVPTVNPDYEIRFLHGSHWRRMRTFYCRRGLSALVAGGFRPDWIFATTWNFSRGIVRPAAGLGSRLVTVVHGLEVTRSMSFLKKLWMRRTLAASDSVVAVSTFTAERTMRACGLPAGKVLVFPNGVDTDRYRPGLDASGLRTRHGLDGAKVILTLARVVERKGHDTVIRCMPEVLRSVPEARYLICGSQDPEWRAVLDRLVLDLGLEGKVLFTGFVPPSETPLFYNLCDAYAMPSREIERRGDTEGFGITFLEANACGKPVVGGRSGGVEDAVSDGETGFLVDPVDPGAVAGKLIRLLRDPDLAAGLGANGRKRVEQSFTWDTIARRLFERLSEPGEGRAP
jgi:phosphatidyl-myo-inositol dimannoside synthase